MTPPQIRYPLPTLLVLIALVVIARFAAPATRSIRDALAARWKRVVEGPPIPSSTEPQIVAGPIIRRVLVLREGVVAHEKPQGAAAETIRRRMFADVYDVWPLAGTPEYYRIGNRHPFGWVPASAVLPWNTRLVVRLPRGPNAPGSVRSGTRSTVVPQPVLGQDGSRTLVATWEEDHPWEIVDQTQTFAETEIPPDAWGVFLSREDLLGLLRQMMAAAPEPRDSLRLRAVVGRVGAGAAFSSADVHAAQRVLPPRVFARSEGSTEAATERLARINDEWRPDAAWSGLTFQFVPLDALP